MEAKQLVILFIVLLLATSCTKEIEVISGEESQEKVPVSLQLVLDATTKTKSGDWKYEDYFPEILPEEQIVTDVLLVVFKGNYLEEYDYYGENDFTQENDYSITLSDDDGGDLLELEPGPHYFYAIANLSDDLHSTLLSELEGKEKILSKNEFERLITTKSLDDLTGRGQKFIMTNSNPPELRGIYSQEQIENSEGFLHNNIAIQIGRAIGKISFAYVADLVQTGELHGSLSDISYKILNNPTKMFVMPVFENNILITPHYEYTTYPSGYFTPWIKDTNIGDDTVDSPWLPATITQSLADGDEQAYGYCTENHNKNPLKSTSTMLLIRAKFTPTVWVNPDGTTDGINIDGTTGTRHPDGTFYRIGHYNANNVLFAYLQGYYNAPPLEVLTALGTPSSGGGTYKIDEYTDGITYYGFWPEYNDRFQVKRNNYFKIAITHVHGAGYTSPGDVINPDVDPDEEPTRGRPTMSAESWVDEQMIITLGEEPDDDSNADSDVKDWEDGNDQDETLGEGDNNNKFD